MKTTPAQRRASKKWSKNNSEYISRLQKIWRRKNPEKWLLCACKSRAKRNGIEFNLDLSDITIPKLCPYLGIELKISNDRLSQGSPSIDRVDNAKGYVKGNVEIISHQANLMKSNSSPYLLCCFAREILRRFDDPTND